MACSTANAFAKQALHSRLHCLWASESGLAMYLPPGLRMAGARSQGAAGSQQAGQAKCAAESPPPQTEHRPQGVPVEGQVRELSFDPDGCREVQHALDAPHEPGACRRISSELRGCIAEAAQSPYANYVLQKCVAKSGPEEFQFILDEILSASAPQMAQHKFGCRVLQRLMEHGSPRQVAELSETLLPLAPELALDRYGNYVVQHMLKHCAPEHVRRVMASIEQHVALLCRSPFGNPVVRAAVAHGPAAESATLARAIAQDPATLEDMASAPEAIRTIQIVLGSLDIAERSRVVRALKAVDVNAKPRGRRGVPRAGGEKGPK